MKFFYADTLDHVDPGFDFEKDCYSPNRTPQRDDVYAHELMAPNRPYDGLLVSRYALEGRSNQGRYSMAQQQRFLRQGAQRFLRFPPQGTFDPDNYPILADCGAYNYREEHIPPYSAKDMIDFYDSCGFTHGVSVDHMIGGYDPSLDKGSTSQMMLPGISRTVPGEWLRRYQITLDNAADFLRKTKAGSYRFVPMGVVQGWSPNSYREAVQSLIKMGYKSIALGGLVPLKTPEILAILESVREETEGKIPLHLFGISRLENFDAFRSAGVHSFDSTSPLRQAFKDARNNYYADSPEGHYTAIRIPQVDDNRKLVTRIRQGKVNRSEAFRLEQDCLAAVRGLDRGEVEVDEAIKYLRDYDELFGGSSKWPAIRRTLIDRPWKQCPCPVCSEIGVEAIIFRGSNRNKRRGFHNLWFTHQQLQSYREEAQETEA